VASYLESDEVETPVDHEGDSVMEPEDGDELSDQQFHDLFGSDSDTE